MKHLRIGLIAVASAFAPMPAAALPTTASWLDAVDGDWDDATKWSTPVFPNNGSPTPSDSYDVVIDAGGASYSVRLDTDVTVDKLALDSSDATLVLNRGTFQVLDGFNVRAGLCQLFGGGSQPYPTIRGTRVVTEDEGRIEIIKGQFDDVSLAGKAKVGYRQELRVANGLTLDGGRLDSSGTIRFGGDPQTIGGNGVLDMSGNVMEYFIETDHVLTIDEGVRVEGSWGAKIWNQGTLVNKGVIACVESSDGGFSLYCTPNRQIINEGILQASNRGELSVPVVPGKWTNTGRIVVDDGTLILQGTFDQPLIGTIDRNGGSILVEGTVDNAGKTFRLDASTGSWQLESHPISLGGNLGGRIVGGTVETADGAELLVGDNRWGGLFGGVVLDGNATAYSRSRVTVQDGLTLNGRFRMHSRNYTRFMFEGTQTLDGSGEFVFFQEGPGADDLGAVYPSEGVLTIGPQITIRTGDAGGVVGSSDAGDGIVNRGTISAQTPGETIQIRGTSFQNLGTLEARDGGTLRVELAPWTNEGTIRVDGGTVELTGNSPTNALTGRIEGSGTLDVTATMFLNSGTVAPGLSTGVLTIDGNYRHTGDGTLTIELFDRDAGGFDRLAVTGTATLAGTLEVELLPGAVFEAGDELEFLEATSIDGRFDDLLLPTLPGGEPVFDVDYDAQSVKLTALRSIPEPSSLVLLLMGPMGLAVCGWLRRKVM